MKKLFFAFWVLLVFCSFAHGSERYEYIGNDTYGSQFYVDTRSIRFTDKDNIARVWAKVNISAAQRKAYVESTNDKKWKNILKKTYELKIYFEIDFEQNAYRTLSSMFYSAKGERVFSNNNPEYWDYIAPDSIGERIRDAVIRIVQRK